MSDQAVAILSSRGAFYKVSLSTNYSPSMYAVAGLNVPDTSAIAASQDALSTIASLRNANATILNELSNVNENLANQQNQQFNAEPQDDSPPSLTPNPGWVSLKNSLTAQLAQNTQKIADANAASVPPISPDLKNFPILISGIATTQTDIVSLMSCLSNVKVIYTFGQNFGTVAIRGEVLLGPMGISYKQGVQQIEDYFWQNRVSVTGQPIKFSICDNAFFAYLTGLEIHDVIVEFHVLPFAIYGTLLDISRNNTALINPNSTVLTSGNLGSASVIAALNNRSSQLQTSTATNSSSAASSTGPTPLPASPAAKPASPTSNNVGQMTDANAIIASKQAAGQPLSNDEMQLQQMTKDQKDTDEMDPDNAQTRANQISQLQSSVVANQDQVAAPYMRPTTADPNFDEANPGEAPAGPTLGPPASTLPAETTGTPYALPASNPGFDESNPGTAPSTDQATMSQFANAPLTSSNVASAKYLSENQKSGGTQP